MFRAAILKLLRIGEITDDDAIIAASDLLEAIGIDEGIRKLVPRFVVLIRIAVLFMHTVSVPSELVDQHFGCIQNNFASHCSTNK